MQSIEITGATGIGPYDVYLCDITLNYCFLISGSTTIPPTVSFVLPKTFTNPLPPPTNIVFGGTDSLIIKLVDLGSGCEKFIPYYCSSPIPQTSLKANWYNMVESPEYIFGNIYTGCYDDLSSITFTITSLNVDGTEYIITPSSTTVDTSTITIVNSTNNISYGGCPPSITSGVTYSNLVDFINTSIQSFSITGITAQTSTKTIVPPPSSGPTYYSGFYIVYESGHTFSIDIDSGFPNPFCILRYAQDGLYYDLGPPFGYQIVPHYSYQDYILDVTPIVGGVVIE